jgi:hypothetical protein
VLANGEDQRRDSGDERGEASWWHHQLVATVAGDFELSVDELREVTRHVAEAAQELLRAYELAHPLDVRPRAAIHAV